MNTNPNPLDKLKIKPSLKSHESVVVAIKTKVPVVSKEIQHNYNREELKQRLKNSGRSKVTEKSTILLSPKFNKDFTPLPLSNNHPSEKKRKIIKKRKDTNEVFIIEKE